MNLTLYDTRALGRIQFPTVRQNRPTIGLLIETSTAYGRGVLRGVQSYLRQHADWRVFVPELSGGDLTPRSIGEWRCEGAIVRLESAALANAVDEWDVPTIDVSAHRILPYVPAVCTDDEITAKMAFEHVYEQGFRQVAYCGMKGPLWSAKRRDEFTDCARRAGIGCYVYESNGRRTWNDEQETISAWLAGLPRPLAIMASHDRQGVAILDACRASAIQVPQEVAVIAVDNDELLCDLADPPMSSIFPDVERIGYAAARYLDRLLGGDTDVPLETLIRPIGVVARRSTDSFAIDDPDVAAAARYIRNHAIEGIKVADVLEAVPMARRVLESRFRTYLGRTPHQEILRVQLSHVRALLR